MPHDMKNGRDYDYGSGPGGGMGTMHGQIASPLDPCGYDISPSGGGGVKGGEPSGPFGQYQQSSSVLPITVRDSLPGAPQEGFANLGGAQGRFMTPMDNSKSAMPGVRGSDGTGAISGGEAKISSPWVGPWGDSVGSK